MREILVKNSVRPAIVDDEDFEQISLYTWYLSEKGYAVAKPARRTIRMHRIIAKTPKGKLTDHVNHDKLDNRRVNLRICNRQQNQQNRRKQEKPTSSIYKGVTWYKPYRKWAAKIDVHGKRTYIGYFDNERHAAMAYDIWARFLYKDFSHCNFPAI